MKNIILIVDDSPDTLLLLERKLHEYDVIIAKSGKEMWNVLQKEEPSLILLDVVLPHEDGFKIAREISSMERYNHIPVVFVTAKSEGKDVEIGFDAGGYDYIKKPFDITELKVRIKSAIEKKENEKNLKYLTSIDPLTGIYNRRYFHDMLEKNIEYRYRNVSLTFSVAIIDIDFFKNVNDEYGHLAGDYILHEFAKIIGTCVRPYDILARYGGEEFVLLIFDCDKGKSNIIISRMKDKIENTTFSYKDHGINITFSCGIADFNEAVPGDTISEDLVCLADNRLYAAKQDGRNRIVLD